VSTHDIEICIKLVSIHTLDAGQRVELKWIFPECGVVKSGEMRMRLAPEDSERYLLGDKMFVHMRGMP
jgi:hypothetical protein